MCLNVFMSVCVFKCVHKCVCLCACVRWTCACLSAYVCKDVCGSMSTCVRVADVFVFKAPLIRV